MADAEPSDADRLSDIWLFSGVSKQNLEKLAPFAFNRTYAPGDVIIEEGRTGNGVYMITSGKVEVVKGMGTDNPQTVATLGQGEVFGEMALLDDSPRSASVRAVETTTCMGIDRWLFLAQLRKEPEVAIAMIQVMARRLRETDARLAE